MPEATWVSGAKLAPDFSLTDQSGSPVSVARFRGHPVIVTFIDPLCRNLCPLEAKVIDSVETSVPASERPAVVAVSVDQFGDARRYLLEDDAKWRLGGNWHWAVGKPVALRRVWRAYEIAVLDSTKTVAGVTVHNISHTEEAFLIDRRGYQRALYLFPFDASDVARTLRRLASAQSWHCSLPRTRCRGSAPWPSVCALRRHRSGGDALSRGDFVCSEPDPGEDRRRRSAFVVERSAATDGDRDRPARRAVPSLLITRGRGQ